MIQVIREMDAQIQCSLAMNALDCTLNVHTIATKLAVSYIFQCSGKHPQFSEYLGCDRWNNFHNKQFQCHVHDLREAEASPLT